MTTNKPATRPASPPSTVARPRGREDVGEKAIALLAHETFYRQRDLEARNIAPNRPWVKRAQERRGFPLGIVVGDNTVVFKASEVDAWVASQPRQRSTEDLVKGNEHRVEQLGDRKANAARANVTRAKKKAAREPAKVRRVG